MELVCDIGDSYDVGTAGGSVFHAVEVASANREDRGGIPESVHCCSTPMEKDSVQKSVAKSVVKSMANSVAMSVKTIFTKAEKKDRNKGSNNDGSVKNAALVLFGGYDGAGTRSRSTKRTAIHQDSMTVL